VVIVKKYIPRPKVAMDKLMSLSPECKLNQLSFYFVGVRGRFNFPEVMAKCLYRKNDALNRYEKPGHAGTQIIDALNTSVVVWIIGRTDP
jgi:hypothetical protein